MSVPIRLDPVAMNGQGLWALYFFCLGLSLMVHIPAAMIAVDRLGSPVAFLVWFVLIEGARFGLFFIGAVCRRAPAAMITFREWSGSIRVFFLSGLLFYFYAGASIWVVAVVLLIWAVQEYRGEALVKAVSTKAVIRQWKKEKVLAPAKQGWVYKLDNNNTDLMDKASGSDQVMGFETKFIAAPLMLIAPALFLISERAGENFEFRSMIAGTLFLFIGYFMMPVHVSARISRRAIRALEAGET